MSTFHVDTDSQPRLDNFLVEKYPDLSRASLQKLIEQHKVSIDGTIAVKAGQKIKQGATVSVVYEGDGTIPTIDLPILYEDDDCLVIDKPLGILTHSKGAFNPEATVASFIQNRVQDIDNDRAGIVHRLDRVTSGVIICAKNSAALSWLQKQFSQRRTKKTYLAIVDGQLEQAAAVIDLPIERNPKQPQTFRVGANGKSALTEYKVLSTTEHYSLVQLQPQTGRTHQLRVHLKYLGHPIVGDSLYGGTAAERVYLHAASLEITIPSRQRKVFESAMPASFTKFLERD